MNIQTIRNHLRGLGDVAIAEHSSGFFKTGKGEYGEGDVFLGIRVPVIRQAVKQFAKGMSVKQAVSLLQSKYHEERLFAVLALVDLYARGDEGQRQLVYEVYLENTDRINNWDLVDASAHKIVGPHLVKGKRTVLKKLAESPRIWERRIAIMTTYHFIRQGDLADTLAISKKLLNDPEDLIHKAVGWMLRELGKQDKARLEEFLDKHVKRMPRTMLRYAIEKFPIDERKAWLNR